MTHKIAVMCGHGRSGDGTWDPGTAWSKYNEADLMMPITKAAVKYLRAKGVTVLTDSDTGNDKNMNACIDWANREKAELYVSVHCDFSGADSGVMPLYVSASGKKLGEALNKAIMAGVPMKSRGVQERTDLKELNATDMTAVILETGSIDDDITIFRQKSDLYGKCIAEGICNYLGIKEEVKPVAIKEYKKYRAKRAVNVYKNHSITSGKVATIRKGEIITGTDWFRDDWTKTLEHSGWTPLKGSLGVYFEPVKSIVYTVTNPGGINIYPDPEHKGKMIVNVKRASQLTATKWSGNQAFFPSVGGWGAISCVTVGNRREVFIKILDRIGKEMAEAGYKYNKHGCALTYAKSKKNKVTDCAHYVSYADQELGLIPYGACFWLDTTFHGSEAAIKAIKSSPVLSVSYPKKKYTELKLEPGDTVGYGYSTGQHMMVFDHYDSSGKPYFMTGGTTDVNNGNFGPKRKTWYENEPIDVLIRIKV